MPSNPTTILSADIEPTLAQENASQLLPHALVAFNSPSPAPAWTEPGFEGRLAYLVCTEDEAIPKFGQEAMIQGTGLEWDVREIVGSHTAPFLKKTGETLQAVEDFIKRFLRAGA